MRVFSSALVVSLFLPLSAFSASFSLWSQEPGVGAFLAEVEGYLPARMKAVLGEPIVVRFASLDNSSSIAVTCAGATLRPQKLAKVDSNLLGQPKRPYTIVLSQNFLPIINKGEAFAASFPCGHGNLYRLAIATLVHELAHLYDFSDNLLTHADHAALGQCERMRANEGALSTACAELTSMLGKVSERRSYKNLTGFVPAGGHNKNRNLIRSADPYEYANVREHFAVNMEYFLLDNNFACRRPALYALYSRELETRPFVDEPCAATTSVIGSGTGLTANLDPKRAYQVHFLFASQGKEMMSRWGHAMLRVVMCAPERETVSADCLRDVAHHVVISFRANIDGPMISYWNGLVGRYPSQLLIVSMGEVVDEYNRKELRDLISLPLLITDAQKELLISRALEQYWGYSGKYYFLSNNCASEVDQMVKGVLGEYHGYHDQRPLSPLGVYDGLALERLIDLDLLQSRDESIRSGYFFPSQRGALERAFKLSGGGGDLDDYLNRSSAMERRSRFARSASDQKTAAAFYLLEKSVQRRMENDFQKRSAKMLLEYEQEGARQSDSHLNGLLEKLAKIRDSLLPWNIVERGAGYGVPLVDELVGRDEFRRRAELLRELLHGFGDSGEKVFPALMKEREASRENLKLFLTKMR